MTVALSRLDLVVIGVYLLGMAVAGSLFYRRGADTKEFFLANRAVSWLPLGICIIATDFSAVTYLGSPAFVYQRNLQGLPVNFVQALVVLFLVVPLIVPFYHRLNVFTSYEYREQRFDSACGPWRDACFCSSAAPISASSSMLRCCAFRVLPSI